MRELSVKVTSFPIRFSNTGFRFLRRFHFCDQGAADEWPLPDPTYYRRARSSFFEGVSQLCYCEEESKIEYAYRLLVHDKAIAALPANQLSMPAMRHRLAKWVTHELPPDHELLR